MKDFYSFLSVGYNFFGFIVFLIVVFAGVTSIVKALRGKEGKWRKHLPKESKKQQLND